MEIFLRLLISILEEGLIYGIMALGVYITYRVLNFPDLSVDGTFPLGACVTGALIASGARPVAALCASFGCGLLAGLVTGLLHVRLKITDLLSGILVMTACGRSIWWCWAERACSLFTTRRRSSIPAWPRCCRKRCTGEGY